MTRFKDSPNAPHKAREIDNTEKALTLRAGGASFRAIADALGVSLASTHKLVSAAIARRAEENKVKTDDLVQLELERCDLLQRSIAKKVAEGDVRAIAVALKVMERRARLLGLDSAPKLELTGAGGGPLTVSGPRLFVPKLETETESETEPVVNTGDARGDG